MVHQPSETIRNGLFDLRRNARRTSSRGAYHSSFTRPHSTAREHSSLTRHHDLPSPSSSGEGSSEDQGALVESASDSDADHQGYSAYTNASNASNPFQQSSRRGSNHSVRSRGTHSSYVLRRRSSTPGREGSQRSRSFQRKTQIRHYPPPKDSAQANFIWLYQHVRFSTMFGTSGWPLAIVALAILILLARVFPCVPMVWRALVGAWAVFRWSMTVGHGTSGRISQLSVRMKPTLCGLPVLPKIIDCVMPTSLSVVDETLADSIGVLTGDPGNSFLASRLLEKLGNNLSPFAYELDYDAAQHLTDGVSKIAVLMTSYDGVHDTLLHKICSDSAWIIRVYEKIITRAWYNSKTQIIISWIGNRDVWDEFYQRVALVVDDWASDIAQLASAIDTLLEKGQSTQHIAKSLNENLLEAIINAKDDQGLWMGLVRAPMTVEQHKTRDTIRLHTELENLLMEAFPLLQAVKGSVELAQENILRAKQSIAADRALWTSFNRRTVLIRKLLTDLKRTLELARKARMDRDNLRAPIKVSAHIDGPTVDVKRRG